MAITATSLKLPEALKTRIARLARRSGETPHALMVKMIADQVDAAERHQALLADARKADSRMSDTGHAYAAADVHAYLDAVVSGRKPSRPKPVAWRK
jgi:predicted transcriptional regulator